MAASISFVNVLNNHYELKAMPVSETIELLFLSKPNMNNIEAHVSLVRIDSAVKYPNIGEIFNNNPGFIPYGYESVDIDYELVNRSGREWVLTLKPKVMLIPNSDYVVIVSKNLVSEYWTKTKQVTLGGSDITIVTSDTGSGDNASYELSITTSSYISGGSHVVGYSLTRNGSPVNTNTLIDITSKSVTLSNGTSISFDRTSPFVAGELFLLTTTKFTRLGSDYAEQIHTAISDKTVVGEKESSKRLENSDILKFYEKNAWLSPKDAPVLPSENSFINEMTADIEYVDIDKFILRFPEEVNMDAITPASFTFKFGPVFKNYLLPKMGLYDKDKMYIVKYELLSNTDILISLEENLDPLAVDKYLVEEI